MKHLRWLLMIILATAGNALAQESIEKNVSVDRDAVVEIENLAGTVKVIGWDRDRLEIRGTMGRGTEAVVVRGGGRRVSIEVELREGRHLNIEGTDLEIHAPRGIRLDVETISASITVEGLDNEIEIETVSGRTRIYGDALQVAVGSVSGGIELFDSAREVELESVSGSIVVKNAAGMREGEFQTISGSIHLRAYCPRGSEYDLETVSGSIDLRIPAGKAFELEVETFSGRIDTDFGRPRKTDQYLPSQSLRVATGEGGAEISIKSFSGTVRIRED